jgi:hypothetical protein
MEPILKLFRSASKVETGRFGLGAGCGAADPVESRP